MGPIEHAVCQIAFKIEKKYQELSLLHEEMIKNKNTETLGYKGLMEENIYKEDYHHAFIYGENKNPEWLSEELVQVELKDNPTIINNIPVNTNDLVDFSYDENENDLHKLADSMTGSVVTDINDNNLKLLTENAYKTVSDSFNINKNYNQFNQLVNLLLKN